MVEAEKAVATAEVNLKKAIEADKKARRQARSSGIDLNDKEQSQRDQANKELEGAKAALDQAILKLTESSELALPSQLNGLAFSGGGIRAACTALGFTQGLMKEEANENESGSSLFDQFDYLSTVSGGGYTGAMLSALATHVNDLKELKEIQARREFIACQLRPEKEGELKEKAPEGKELNPQIRIPVWKRLLHRGDRLGDTAAFLSRHFIATVLFNIGLVSLLVCTTCFLALVWRTLDTEPIIDFLWWGSHHRIREVNRPFIIPLALGMVMMLVAISRPASAWCAVVLVTSLAILFALFTLGMPVLIISTIVGLWVLIGLIFLHKWAPSAATTSYRLNRWCFVAVAALGPWLIAGLSWLVLIGALRLNRCLSYCLFTPLLLFPTSGLTVATYFVSRGLSDSQHGVAMKVLWWLFFGSLFVGVAVWLATPSMNFRATPRVEQNFNQDYIRLVLPAIVALIVPFLKPQALFKSGQATASPQKRWLFNMASAALLFGVPFLFVYFFAHHNLSGFDSDYGRNWKRGDFPRETLKQFASALNECRFRLDRTQCCLIELVENKEHPGRIDPFNDTWLPIPGYMSTAADNESFGKEFCEPGWIHRKYQSKHQEDELYRSLAENLDNEIQCRQRWPERIGSVPPWEEISPFVKRLDRELLHLVNQPENTLSKQQKAHQAEALQLLQLLHLRPEDFTSPSRDPKQAALHAEERQRKLAKKLDDAMKQYLTPTKLDKAFANLLFHVAFADVLAPMKYPRRSVVIGPDQKARLIIIVISLMVCILAFLSTDLNATSMQNYYRRQLTLAFLQPTEMTPQQDAHKLRLGNLNPCAVGFPYHLLGGCVSRQDSRRDPPAETSYFEFGGKTYGSSEFKYAPPKWANCFPTLSEAMAVSGAAVSVYQTQGNYLLLATMIITNFRLGQWLRHPCKLTEKDAKREVPLAMMSSAYESYFNAPGVRKDTKEAHLVFVTDGGHHENLGIEPLLRRKCKVIVGLDAGADPNGLFENLLNLLQVIEHERLVKKIALSLEATRKAAKNAGNLWYDRFMGTEEEEKNRKDGKPDTDRAAVNHFTLRPVMPAHVMERLLGPLTSPIHPAGNPPDEGKNANAGETQGEREEGTSSQTSTTDKLEKGGPKKSKQAKPIPVLPSRQVPAFNPFGLLGEEEVDWKQFSASHVLVFDITYLDDSKGTYVYVRSSLTGDEPPELLIALNSRKPFPHHSTSEQVFDEELFELYRRLGFHLAQAAAGPIRDALKPSSGMA